MTTKPKKAVELHDGEEWVDVTEDVAEPVKVERGAKSDPEPVSLHGMTAEAALLLLRALKSKGEPVVLEAPIGAGDETVVDGHAYGGARVGGAWHFTAKALDMACRVAGWKVQHVEPGKVRLS